MASQVGVTMVGQVMNCMQPSASLEKERWAKRETCECWREKGGKEGEMSSLGYLVLSLQGYCLPFSCALKDRGREKRETASSTGFFFFKARGKNSSKRDK